jgi:hypothetical protein
MDEFAKPELKAKEEKLKNQIQEDIHYCLNCQARDSGDWIWILGERYDLEDLFDDYEIKESLRDKISEYLYCPNCGTDLNRYDEIGLEEKYDIEIKGHLKEAKKKYGKRISKLSQSIKKYPTLALTLPLGKSIYKEIKSLTLPRCKVEGDFFRARKISDSRIMSNEDFLAPPIGKSEEGRFNHSGQSHFYISDDKETAIYESLGVDEPSLIWIQKFELTTIDNVLDLSYNWDHLGPSTSTLLVALHDSSVLEQSNENKERWKPDYYITRFIMDCAKKSGYNGIRYNTTKNSIGKNTVLFECKQEWILSFEKPEVLIHNPQSKNENFEDLFPFSE